MANTISQISDDPFPFAAYHATKEFKSYVGARTYILGKKSPNSAWGRRRHFVLPLLFAGLL